MNTVLKLCAPLSIWVLSGQAQAQDKTATANNPLPATKNQPSPYLDPGFDEQTVSDLLSSPINAEKYNALKVAYFADKSFNSFTKDKALVKVDEMLGKTPPVEDWFCLESLRGFGSFQTKVFYGNQGVTAYSALFSRAGEAKTQWSKFVVAQSAREFVILLIHPGSQGLLKQKESGAALLSAWDAYQQCVDGVPSPRSIPWGGAASAIHSEKALTEHIEKGVTNLSSEGTMLQILSRADALIDLDPPTAAKIMEGVYVNDAAKTQILKDKRLPVILHQIVENCLVANDFARAIMWQQRLTNNTQKGYAALILLTIKSNPTGDITPFVQAIKQSSTRDDEIKTLQLMAAQPRNADLKSRLNSTIDSLKGDNK